MKRDGRRTVRYESAARAQAGYLLATNYLRLRGGNEFRERNRRRAVVVRRAVEIDVDQVVGNGQEHDFVQSRQTGFPVVRVPADGEAFGWAPRRQQEGAIGHDVLGHRPRPWRAARQILLELARTEFFTKVVRVAEPDAARLWMAAEIEDMPRRIFVALVVRGNRRRRLQRLGVETLQ